MQQRLKRIGYRAFAFVFWLSIWQVISIRLDEVLFLPSPLQVFQCLTELIVTQSFWQTILYSVIKIFAGFLLAVIIGVLLAGITYKIQLIREIIMVAMHTIKSVPVVSFIILALLWVKSKNLSILISFLMVLPMIYTNVTTGIASTDAKMLEMAKVFRITRCKVVRYIYIPAILPYFISACSVAVGFCWKSGIAAEVIGNVEGSIGGELFDSKLYFNIPQLFAWTVVIVVVSIVFEYIVKFFIKKVEIKIKNRNQRIVE